VGEGGCIESNTTIVGEAQPNRKFRTENMKLFAESQDKKKMFIKCIMLNNAFWNSHKYKDLGLLGSDSG